MFLSIVIPSTGPRSELLLTTLQQALEALRLVPDLQTEIIVVANTKAIPVAHEQLTIVRVDYNNVSRARNDGARQAQGRFLLFIDDDMLLRAQNLERIRAVVPTLPENFLLNLNWIHSEAVELAKKTTAVGQLALHMNPNDSFEKRYRQVHEMKDWCADQVFKSALTTEFSEACFVMQRSVFEILQGFDEQFLFGGEGAEFLSRALRQGVGYYIDPLNQIWHNEVDKYTNWQLEVTRAARNATNENTGVTHRDHTAYSVKAKLYYGLALQPYRKKLSRQLQTAFLKPVQNEQDLQKLKANYSQLLQISYWGTLSWKTIVSAYKR